MAAPPIPTWKERLAACFRWRHRLLHVVGVPMALGAAAAVASGSALNPDVGMALGALAATVGAVIAGYFVTAGFDKKLVAQLQREAQQKAEHAEAGDLQRAIWEAEPELKPLIERILFYQGNIEQTFADGIDDPIEAVLQSSREAIRGMRDRAVALVKLHGRLRQIIQQTDSRGLYEEIERMNGQLGRIGEGAARDALVAAKESAENTLGEWKAAIDKQAQIRSVLAMIESTLQGFKLKMELRKADATMGSERATTDVGDLQARLAAAVEACDELSGRTARAPRRVRRRET